MRVVHSLLPVVAIPIFLFTLLGFGDHEGLIDGYQRWQESKVIYRQALAENDQLREERDRYARQIERLRSDPLEQERLVRSVGYIKSGETVYRIVRPELNGEAEGGRVHMGNLTPK